jgi:hypothetical protein
MRSVVLAGLLAAPLASALRVGSALRPTAGAARTSGRLRAIADLVRPDRAPALSGRLPDCPSTVWNADDIDIDEWQSTYRKEDLPVCPIEIHATDAANAAGAAWFLERRAELKATLEKHGCIWFRGFELTKDADGFRSFWEALGLDPCLDPLHTSGLRKFLSKVWRAPVQRCVRRWLPICPVLIELSQPRRLPTVCVRECF